MKDCDTILRYLLFLSLCLSANSDAKEGFLGTSYSGAALYALQCVSSAVTNIHQRAGPAALIRPARNWVSQQDDDVPLQDEHRTKNCKNVLYTQSLLTINNGIISIGLPLTQPGGSKQTHKKKKKNHLENI